MSYSYVYHSYKKMMLGIYIKYIQISGLLRSAIPEYNKW